MKKKIIRNTVIVFIGAMISLLGFSLTSNVFDYDTVWLYLFSNKIIDGYMLYRDYNMVVTPLSTQISALFLKTFGNTLVVFTIISSLYGAILLSIEHLIMKKLKVNNKIVVFILLYMLLQYIIIQCTTYNVLMMIFLLLLIYVEICKIKCEKYQQITGKIKRTKVFHIKYTTLQNILMGSILGFTFLTKQNVGAITILFITVYYFSKAIWLKKQSLSKSFFELCLMSIFCMIPILCEEIYFWKNDALYQMIDYTFGGLRSFKQNMSVNLFENMLTIEALENMWIYVSILLSMTLLPITLILKKKELIKSKNSLNTEILLFLSFCTFIAYSYLIPISNVYHVRMASMIDTLLLLIVVLSFRKFSKELINQISKTICKIAIVIPIICGILLITIYCNRAYKTQLNKIENSYIPMETEFAIKTVITYIDSYEKTFNEPLYPITSDDAIYSLIMNRNNGIFDLPLYGNLGKEDYMAIINKLRNMNNYSVMIYREVNEKESPLLFWQESKEVQAYIRSNFEKMDTFYNYDVYRKK